MATGQESIKEALQKKKPSLKYQRDKDREMVKGIFRFFEVPGGFMEFNIKLYKEDPVEKYSLMDGQIYTLPLGVARHLNKNGWYPIHDYRVEENGKASQFVGKKARRFGFQSLEFVDIDDFGTGGASALEIVTAI